MNGKLMVMAMPTITTAAPTNPQPNCMPRKNAVAAPALTRPMPRQPQAARACVGLLENHLWDIASWYIWLSAVFSSSVNVPLRSDSVTCWRPANRPARIVFSYGMISDPHLGQDPILLAWYLRDREEASHGQVDDGRGQILRVGALIEDQAKLGRAQVLWRLELHHHRVMAEEWLRMLLRIVCEVVLRQVGAIAPMGPPVPGHEPDPGDAHERGYADRQRVDVESIQRELTEPRPEE